MSFGLDMPGWVAAVEVRAHGCASRSSGTRHEDDGGQNMTWRHVDLKLVFTMSIGRLAKVEYEWS